MDNSTKSDNKIKQEPIHQIRTRGQKVFSIFNTVILLMLALVCILPFWYIVCLSFSSSGAVMAGYVKLLPVDFTIQPYRYLLERPPFWNAFAVTLKRVALGLPLSLFLLILSAYPLSKDKYHFKARFIYVWYFFFTMLFNGGMIPNYLLVKQLKMIDTIWALVLPCCLNVFNMLLLLSFFRQLSSELEDAAFMDGASHWRILWQIFVPISMPVLATVTLFIIVFHWNSWFDGLIYMRDSNNAPLQTYLRTIIMNFRMTNLTIEEQMRLAKMAERSVKASQMVIGAIPVLCVYPFLQRYFISGITLGAVKG